MWLGRSMCVGGFEVHLVGQRCSHLSHAMGIVGHHTCNVAGAYCDSGMWGLLDDY